MKRCRFRDLGMEVGKLPTGKFNAITDVEGVVVGNKTIMKEDVKTGLTVIMPNEGIMDENHFPAGIFTFNGTGEFTGSHWIEETGALVTPIVFTGSNILGIVHHHLSRATRKIDKLEAFSNGVVGETWDGWLSDLEESTVQYEDVEEAILKASGGEVEEGNVGGGTGMFCFEFKGGIGTSSRRIESEVGEFTVGAIVQTNFGRRDDFTFRGIKVGEIINEKEVPLPWDTPQNDGSMLVAIATDAPLTAGQCRRISKRASLAMRGLGAIGEEGSGDFFITFSTGNSFNYGSEEIVSLKMFPNEELDCIFEGVVESVEEAILNSMCMAETLKGQKGRVIHELPLDRFKEILR